MTVRLLRASSVYPRYAWEFYARHPGLADQPYATQERRLFEDAFGWGDAWRAALEAAGHQAAEVVLHLPPLQQAWAREHLGRSRRGADLHAIAIAQIKAFSPEILWFDDQDGELLGRIRSEVPSIRLVLGWTGSAIPKRNAFAHCDVVLSCARESVDRLAAAGHRAEELHHGFDPRVLERLPPARGLHDLVFVGQLIRAASFHLARESLLEQLVDALPVTIFSESPQPTPPLRRLVKGALGSVYRAARSAGLQGLADRALGLIGRGEEWLVPPPATINPRLSPCIRGPVYGIAMYQAVRDARVTLNVHADSSDRFASNMRLFEVTGVGGCLLTDWKANLGDIFRLDQEVVAYRSPAECVEKALWLLRSPEERNAIARAGQARTLAEHTFAHRVPRLLQIVERALAVRARRLQERSGGPDVPVHEAVPRERSR